MTKIPLRGINKPEQVHFNFIKTKIFKMRKLILATASFIAENGTKNLGAAVGFCLTGTRFHGDERKQAEKLEDELQKLRQRNIIVHSCSDLTDSETRALKTIRADFSPWKKGGFLVITNEQLIVPLAEALKKEFGEVFIVKSLEPIGSAKSDGATGEGEVHQKTENKPGEKTSMVY